MRSVLKISNYIVAALLLASCSTTRQVSPSLSVSQNEIEEGNVLRAQFTMPVRDLDPCQRLIVMPRLMADSQNVLHYFEPMAVDAARYARKLHRKEVLENYIDTLASRAVKADRTGKTVQIHFEHTIILPPSIEQAYVDAIVATEGCGEYNTEDTLLLANVVRKATPVDTFSLQWIHPTYDARPKVVNGKGTALLQFAINSDVIDPSRGDNFSELSSMEQALAPVLSDTLASLQFLRITGMASADGSLSFNTALAQRRAQSAKKWLTQRLQLTPHVQQLITTDSRPEGWQPVLEAMHRAGDADSTRVKNILLRYPSSNDDVQERHIRRLACWNKIKDNYLQSDRKVEYSYAYTIRSFTTDSELKDMYVVRKDAFSEEEFLRLAELLPALADKIEVYRTLLHYYPNSGIGANNLKVLEHRMHMQHNGATP